MLAIALPRPTSVESAEVRLLIDKKYGLVTAGSARPSRALGREVKLQLSDRLPDADSTRIEAVLVLLLAATPTCCNWRKNRP